MTETAASQLRRILLLIPLLADGEEHDARDLASRLGVDHATLMRDIRALVTRFDEPGGFVDGVQLYIAGDRVSLASRTFLRPMRLTTSELSALELGLTMLRAERAPSGRDVIDRALERLGRCLVETPGDTIAANSADALVGAADPPQLALLRRAMAERRKVRVTHRASQDGAPRARILSPYSLVITSGGHRWHVIAHSDLPDAVHVFRIDRIDDAELTDERFEIPATFSLEDALPGRKVLRVERPRVMRVRYVGQAAREIAKRDGVPFDPDGTVTVEHPMTDVRDAARQVLRFGAEACVLEPPDLRAEVARRLGLALRSNGMRADREDPR